MAEIAAISKVFANYLSQQKVLIADPNTTSRSFLANTMVSLGAKGINLKATSSYEEAERLMKEMSPKVVICDYTLGKRCGLDLLQRQREANPGMRDGLFILVTGNSSQSAVAHAAEEDIDTFILKPFTKEILFNSITKAALKKISPSPYLQAIQEGRRFIEEQKLADAEKKFREACTMDPRPSLALGYLGQVEALKKLLDDAQSKYAQGLNFNKIHYKCMVGMFDVLMEQKNHTQAYDVVKRISRYFPANPKRMTQVLRLAIMTQSYDDVEAYYHSFKNIDERNEEMVRYVCAALMVCGKYYLKRGISSRAVELFQNAAVTSGAAPKLLREVVGSLTEAKLIKPAGEFLKRFRPEHQSGPEYLVSQLLVMEQTEPAGRTVAYGRTLVDKKLEDPAVFFVMIRQSGEAHVVSAIDELLHQANKRWPEKKIEFEKAALDARRVARATPPSDTPPKK